METTSPHEILWAIQWWPSSLYDNFCKTGNYVIYDVIIWFQDGNCKKMARENSSIGAFYSAARIVTGSRRSEHALPILAELHWLQIKHRIQYKTVVTVFKVLTTQQPSYLANTIRFRAASRQLRSCGRNLLHDDRTNLAFADRSHAAPAVWNSLPLDVVSDLSCLATFKRLVKSELYNRAYLRWFVTTRTYDSSLCEWL